MMFCTVPLFDHAYKFSRCLQLTRATCRHTLWTRRRRDFIHFASMACKLPRGGIPLGHGKVGTHWHVRTYEVAYRCCFGSYTCT